MIKTILSWIGISEVAQFIALKAVLYALFVVVLPLILWNLGIEWVSFIFGWVNSQLPTDNYIATFSGFVGWALIKLKIDLCIEILVNTLVTRLIIKVVI